MSICSVGRFFTFSIPRLIVVFALSVPVAFANPTGAQFLWIAAIIPGFLLRNQRRAVVLQRADDGGDE